MKFSVQREAILKPLQLLGGVVEKRQTLPILSNVLLDLREDGLFITATDLEMEVVARIQVNSESVGSTTVPLKKLQDSCRALVEGSLVHLDFAKDKALLKSGKSRFSLVTLPAENFPVIDSRADKFQFLISQRMLKKLLEKTHFAMALQDVRFYLNGLLLEMDRSHITAVATDGHRLAKCQVPVQLDVPERLRAIVPRKAVIELARLLEDKDEEVIVMIGENFIRVVMPEITFSAKLIDGQYPNYEGVIPRGGDKILLADRELLKNCLIRTSILSNEKYRGIRLEIGENRLRAAANNPEQEEAEDEIEVQYDQLPLMVGFNVAYLIDAMSAVDGELVKMAFTDAGGSVLISPSSDDSCEYVVMPMRL